MKEALQGVAREISHSLALELVSRRGVEGSAQINIPAPLLQQLAEEVVKGLRKAGVTMGSTEGQLDTRLQRVEKRLERLCSGHQDDDEDEMTGTGSGFPNLKYAKPKYKNIGSLLKYVEKDEDKGAVKLVIMNFND